MGPERAVGSKRFIGENIQRRRAKRAVIQACQDLGFVLQAAAAGIDQDRRTHRAAMVELCEQSAIQNVSGIRRQRQQADQNIGCLQKRFKLRGAVKAVDPVDRLAASAPARHAKAEWPQRLGGVRSQRAKAHDADRYRACRPLKFWRPALLALARPQIWLLPMMHQHVKHDIFRHPLGEVADRNPNQRHFWQARIRHQRIDAGAQIENHPQVGKCRKLARSRLPDRGIVDLGRIERRPGQLQHPAVAADLLETALPPLRRPVFGPAMHQQGERSLVHRILPHGSRNLARPYKPGVSMQNISDSCRLRAYSLVLLTNRNFRTLYPLLCYHDEDFTGSWTREQDDAVMKKLAVVQDKLTKQGRLGPVARLLPTTSATTLRKDDPPVVLDGPYAETKEQLLGFYVVDCKNLDEALDVARDLGAANPGGAYEIRPVEVLNAGSLRT